MTQRIDSNKVWSLYGNDGVTFEESISLATKVECVNGEWSLPADAETMCAAMLKLGHDVFLYMKSDDHVCQMAYFARVGAYHRIQQAVEALHPDELGSLTDPWTAESFSDIFRDRHGFRPRHYTAKEMRDWLKSPDALRN